MPPLLSYSRLCFTIIPLLPQLSFCYIIHSYPLVIGCTSPYLKTKQKNKQNKNKLFLDPKAPRSNNYPISMKIPWKTCFHSIFPLPPQFTIIKFHPTIFFIVINDWILLYSMITSQSSSSPIFWPHGTWLLIISSLQSAFLFGFTLPCFPLYSLVALSH